MKSNEVAELRWLSRREAFRYAKQQNKRMAACEGKRAYASRFIAHRENQRYRGRRLFNIYRCEHCASYHVS